LKEEMEIDFYNLKELQIQIEKHTPKVLLSYMEGFEDTVFQYLDNDLNQEILSDEELEDFCQESMIGDFTYDPKKGVTKDIEYFVSVSGFIPLSHLQKKLNSFLSNGGNDWENFVELFFTDIQNAYDFKKINGLEIQDDCIGDQTFINNIGWNY